MQIIKHIRKETYLKFCFHALTAEEFIIFIIQLLWWMTPGTKNILMLFWHKQKDAESLLKHTTINYLYDTVCRLSLW